MSLTTAERDQVIEAILEDIEAPEYLITNVHADQWREHLRKHLPVGEDR